MPPGVSDDSPAITSSGEFDKAWDVPAVKSVQRLLKHDQLCEKYLSLISLEFVVSAELPTVAVKIETNHGLNYTVVVPKFPVRCNPSFASPAADGKASSLRTSKDPETLNQRDQDGGSASS